MRAQIELTTLLNLVLVTTAFSAEKAPPKQPIISTGMKLTEALRILRSEGVQAEELFRAVVPADPKMQLKEFLVYPQFEKGAALIISAQSPIAGKPNYVVTSLKWDLNYVEDCKFPYTLRAHKILYLDHLEVSVLKDLPADAKKEREDYKPPDPNDDPFGTE